MSVQVFGPSAVNPDFTTTGEKTLLTMNTTLSSGGRNVILAVFMRTSALNISAVGTLRIKKGSTILYETKIAEVLNNSRTRAKHALVIAVDDSPSGNDSYTFTVNITTAGSSSGNIHVQGMVVKIANANNVGWGYNDTAVSIAAGGTATVVSLSTSFPLNSKFVVLATVYGGRASGTGNQFINAGNIRLNVNDGLNLSTITNQFQVGTYATNEPIWMSLMSLRDALNSSQSFAVVVQNNSGVAMNFYAEIVAFVVGDGAFLDTDSVALTSGSQVLVGDLSTTLNGDVAVIALAAAENTSSSAVTGFNAGDVVLQLNNSTTGQVSNQVGWAFTTSSNTNRSGVLPLFRYTTGVSNPSYQVKMTARAAGFNGEAKILAFTLATIEVVTVSVSDTLVFNELVNLSSQVSINDIMSFSDTLRNDAEIYSMDSLLFMDTVEFPNNVSATDSISFTDIIEPLLLNIADSISFTDNVKSDAEVQVADNLMFTDNASNNVELQVGDSILLMDEVTNDRELQVGDGLSFTDEVRNDIGFYITDDILFMDEVRNDVEFHVTDSITLEDQGKSDAELYLNDTMLFMDEAINSIETHVEDGFMFADQIENATELYATDGMSFTDNVRNDKELRINDDILFIDEAQSDKEIRVNDDVTFTDSVSTLEPTREVTDFIMFNDVASATKSAESKFAKTIKAVKRILGKKRLLGR